MYWASDYFTASTDICGALDMNVSSASGRLAVVGELKQVLDGESPGNHLHTVYHEQAGGGFWAAFYNNTGPHPCFGSNLPVLFRNAISSGDD
jgi:hypothetical protein